MPLEVTLRFFKIFLHHIPQLFHPGLSLTFSSLEEIFPLTFGVFSFLVWTLFPILVYSTRQKRTHTARRVRPLLSKIESSSRVRKTLGRQKRTHCVVGGAYMSAASNKKHASVGLGALCEEVIVRDFS